MKMAGEKPLGTQFGALAGKKKEGERVHLQFDLDRGERKKKEAKRRKEKENGAKYPPLRLPQN